MNAAVAVIAAFFVGERGTVAALWVPLLREHFAMESQTPG